MNIKGNKFYAGNYHSIIHYKLNNELLVIFASKLILHYFEL